MPKNMKKLSKRYAATLEKVDTNRFYTLEEAVKTIKTVATARFDETIELACKLGINPTKAEELVRGTVVLPHGSGKSVRVAVFAKGEKAKEAEAAGADIVGGEELVEKIIKENFFDFDIAVATPDMMREVGKAGRALGPRGLMPNPKSGTVTMDIAKAVSDFKGGKVEYRNDKAGNIHLGVGRASFDEKSLLENVQAVLAALVKAKPSASKGVYMRSVTITSTMGPGIKVDPQSARTAAQ